MPRAQKGQISVSNARTGFPGAAKVILETDRLWLREWTQKDFGPLSKILQDDDVMYAYEGALSDAEVRDWLDRQLDNYMRLGFGLWAVLHKETGEIIGQCGLTVQSIRDRQVLEVGYQFQKAYWGYGYATEAAMACRDYAFDTLNANSVYAIIRDSNLASRNVALRMAMTRLDTLVKHYRGVDMPHDVYSMGR